jgi:hypothetical protein
MFHIIESLLPKEDRVRTHTSKKQLHDIDNQLEKNVRHYAGQSKEAITRRIKELEHEWDIERFLEMNASTLALTGVVLSVLVKRSFLVIPAVVLPFLLQHALQGWCPPIPLFRRFGVRTRQEIERERYALKVLRGDFERLPLHSGAASTHATQVLAHIEKE